MRKIATLVVGSLIAVSMALPSAAAEGDRTVTNDYRITRGMIRFSGGDGEARWWVGTQPEVFQARSGEKRFDLSLQDDTGGPVRALVGIDRNSDGDKDEVLEFCSETPKPISVRAGQRIEVSAVFGSCNDDFSVVTEGTITATFSS